MTTNSQIYLQPLMPVGNQNNVSKHVPAAKNNSQSFADVLKQTSQPIDFSQHALSRMKERNIVLNDADMQKMSDTVYKMAQKGAKESLIYLKGTAFVVSIANKTVITAMDGVSTKDNIFTNIDSAAIL
ncbi:TIGR02530 family flagellar biosynthesis protein [Pectinatus cerevisiiphilus]|uniref:Flagellar operon protein n=1 Tax=Pectinatus cerevisiiphilus TaxID=86956 RepID=A0A4R3KDC6_9FIRM|nr:TIGR02530 family flagellar biosynthesis protein [Pectinatus cerevisiiphilus]TCS80949.1 flagellar operon protein [Pectinatus cerevisiiphilus]